MATKLGRWWLLYAGSASALTVALLLGIWALGGFDEMHLSPNGLIALILAVGATVALSIGLMGLTFQSDRSGHDATVVDPNEEYGRKQRGDD